MKYYIIAGEASGDLHGSNLMKGIYAEDPQAEIRFWGGDCMVGVWAGFRNNPSHSYGAGPSLCGQRGSTVLTPYLGDQRKCQFRTNAIRNKNQVDYLSPEFFSVIQSSSLSS